MAHSRARSITLTAIVVCWSASGLAAGTPTRVGSEFQVNSYTTSYQTQPAAAIEKSSGSFVVAWQSLGQDGGSSGVFGRRFSAAGAPQASEFQANTFTPNNQTYAAVAIGASGFVVVWRSYQDGAMGGIFARRFDASGAALAGEFQVNSFTENTQRGPHVALDGQGDFVVVWDSVGPDGDSYGVFAQRFDSAGARLGGEFQVNSHTPSFQLASSIAMNDAGSFVVAWHSFGGQDGDFAGVFARRFDPTGMPIASEFQVNAYTGGGQLYPRLALDGDGDFVVAWRSDNQDGSGHGVFARRFGAQGSETAEFQVATYTVGNQSRASVAAESDGDFVVAWHSSADQDGSGYGVFARTFDSAGAALGAELQVSTYTFNAQNFPAVASAAEGGFVVAWSSSGQDGDAYGIFAQRFAELAILDIDGNGAVAPLTDGLLVLRFLFGFTGPTLTGGAVENDCTRCDAATIEAYLGGLV